MFKTIVLPSGTVTSRATGVPNSNRVQRKSKSCKCASNHGCQFSGSHDGKRCLVLCEKHELFQFPTFPDGTHQDNKAFMSVSVFSAACVFWANLFCMVVSPWKYFPTIFCTELTEAMSCQAFHDYFLGISRFCQAIPS